MISQLELGKPEERRKPERRVNGIFWIILLNIGIYVADHFFQVVIYCGLMLWNFCKHNFEICWTKRWYLTDDGVGHGTYTEHPPS